MHIWKRTCLIPSAGASRHIQHLIDWAPVTMQSMVTAPVVLHVMLEVLAYTLEAPASNPAPKVQSKAGFMQTQDARTASESDTLGHCDRTGFRVPWADACQRKVDVNESARRPLVIYENDIVNGRAAGILSGGWWTLCPPILPFQVCSTTSFMLDIVQDKCPHSVRASCGQELRYKTDPSRQLWGSVTCRAHTDLGYIPVAGWYDTATTSFDIMCGTYDSATHAALLKTCAHGVACAHAAEVRMAETHIASLLAFLQAQHIPAGLRSHCQTAAQQECALDLGQPLTLDDETSSAMKTCMATASASVHDMNGLGGVDYQPFDIEESPVDRADPHEGIADHQSMSERSTAAAPPDPHAQTATYSISGNEQHIFNLAERLEALQGGFADLLGATRGGLCRQTSRASDSEVNAVMGGPPGLSVISEAGVAAARPSFHDWQFVERLPLHMMAQATQEVGSGKPLSTPRTPSSLHGRIAFLAIRVSTITSI